MLPTVISVLVVATLGAYCVGVFVYDHRRRKKGKPSVFADVCESEGHGKRLVRDFHKKYGASKRSH